MRTNQPYDSILRYGIPGGSIIPRSHFSHFFTCLSKHCFETGQYSKRNNHDDRYRSPASHQWPINNLLLNLQCNISFHRYCLLDCHLGFPR